MRVDVPRQRVRSARQDGGKSMSILLLNTVGEQAPVRYAL
jgi:hypothetical protein